MAVYKPGPPGLGNVASYQVSGKPFVTGGIDLGAATVGGHPLEITFPSVTSWIIVTNLDDAANAPVKVGASLNGLATDNYFTVLEDNNQWKCARTPRMDLKLTKLYLTGTSNNVDIVAGVTGINTTEISGNWTGSVGVG